jgi:hypothetical protein
MRYSNSLHERFVVVPPKLLHFFIRCLESPWKEGRKRRQLLQDGLEELYIRQLVLQ